MAVPLAHGGLVFPLLSVSFKVRGDGNLWLSLLDAWSPKAPRYQHVLSYEAMP
eukprot:CAMPEP_0197691718 /NCGR_PEP_ID=MMETSP1338-20131121/110102_1 /TAXON_ID=43686 ORGANISM="Pelagodinium beii, Strain RCC1491" /NCGR_SAMPLE_ID=MMETSP1338 /ASSEMBLY_ACC=CAM_ASM_000754 /LENGTH=52 /DNA_ID=CAMNT_0043274303 /DNA_START=95 /DNA_END=253 /DNA_ORIENTATION=+